MSTPIALVRYRFGDQTKVGVLRGDAVWTLPAATLAELWALTGDQLRTVVEQTLKQNPTHGLDEVRLQPPIDGRTEVWGAGVTYQRSRAARAQESSFDRVYIEVYDAERPELFFKAPAWRVVTDGDAVGSRDDCTDTVPEPELALVLNAHGECVGALICNDMTARGIEAQNPIYLPQAKLYARACSVSNRIVPWWCLDNPEHLLIQMSIRRDGEVVFEGRTSTASMRRTYHELASWLSRTVDFPDGVLLSTGTGIVPPLGEGVRPGDIVVIEIAQLGLLSNPVVAITEIVLA